ncbi:hypothetical protein [Paenibacillus dakarensis]|uniref:hypothetical protein n=1 Tax=Paenibacillus dakarensis TaxID=1527293 RepID=UPI0006D551D3|nr:hypothetical protein [Paenibacillus dakarensis]
MRNSVRYFLGLFLVFAIFFSFVAPTDAAKGHDLANSYAPQETAVFINGKIKVLKQKTYLANDDNLYVPVRLLDDFDNVAVSYGKSITVTSSTGNFFFDKKNSQIYKNSTYITLKEFLSITGYSAKYISDGSSVFIWNNKNGQTKSNKIINNLTKVPEELKYYLGSKVFIYDTNKTGWVVDLKYSGFGLTYVTIQLNDGKTVEETVFEIEPSSFCLYIQYEAVKASFAGRYYWANSNRLPYSSPLHNIEKVYFTSLDLKDGNLVIKVKRANGNSATLKLPLYGYPSSPIHDYFYSSNPKDSYPNWPKQVWDNIANSKISIGMTKEQVFMSWGAPDDTSTYRSSRSTSDSWYYSRDSLFFYNGVLESISSY